MATVGVKGLIQCECGITALCTKRRYNTRKEECENVAAIIRQLTSCNTPIRQVYVTFYAASCMPSR